MRTAARIRARRHARLKGNQRKRIASDNRQVNQILARHHCADVAGLIGLHAFVSAFDLHRFADRTSFECHA